MAGFLPPMLASPFREDVVLDTEAWCAEEKYDGHRLVLAVSDERQDLFSDRLVIGWSRDGLVRNLPRHITDIAYQLPNGLYDGELIVPGTRSYGVTDLMNRDKLCYTVFDVLELLGQDTTDICYDERRMLLGTVFQSLQSSVIQLAESTVVTSQDHLVQLRDAVWGRGGEGLILKRRGSLYYPGKRSKDFVKIKDLKSAVLTVFGFRKGRLGPFATVLLRDDEGNETSVKTKNDAEREMFALADRGIERLHPALGRRLRIEYQERTPDGNYRHPRWDRWEE